MNEWKTNKQTSAACYFSKQIKVKSQGMRKAEEKKEGQRVLQPLSLWFLFALLAHNFDFPAFHEWLQLPLATLDSSFQKWLNFGRDSSRTKGNPTLSSHSTLITNPCTVEKLLHSFSRLFPLTNTSLFFLRTERWLQNTCHHYLSYLSEGQALSWYLFVGIPLGLWCWKI